LLFGLDCHVNCRTHTTAHDLGNSFKVKHNHGVLAVNKGLYGLAEVGDSGNAQGTIQLKDNAIPVGVFGDL
jgi:hypothetical protein